MIRTLFEFLLSCSFDEGKSPPAWLQRRLRQNEHLRDFEGAAGQLDDLLRSSAEKHRMRMADGPPAATLTLPVERRSSVSHTTPNRHSVRWLGGLAAAAVLLIVVLPGWLRPSTPATHAGEFSQQLSVVPGEVLRLLNHAARTSQQQIPQLSPLADLELPTLPSWSTFSPEIDFSIQGQVDSWRSNLPYLRPQLPDEQPAS